MWFPQYSQSSSLRLRSELSLILIHVPSLVRRSALAIEDQYRFKTSNLVEGCVHEGWETFDKVESWLKRIHVQAQTSAGEACLGLQSFRYSDIIAGVSDCVAHMALMTLDKNLRSLYSCLSETPNSSNSSCCTGLHPLRPLYKAENVLRWRDRVTGAFKFVENKSLIASKPLGFGVQHFQHLRVDALHECP